MRAVKTSTLLALCFLLPVVPSHAESDDPIPPGAPRPVIIRSPLSNLDPPPSPPKEDTPSAEASRLCKAWLRAWREVLFCGQGAVQLPGHCMHLLDRHEEAERTFKAYLKETGLEEDDVCPD